MQYYKVDSGLPWREAQELCKTHGNNLATISNENDQERAYEACSKFDSLDRFNTECWIGGTVNNSDSTTWISPPKENSSYTRLQDGGPAAGCVVMKFGGDWYRDECQQRYPALCASLDVGAHTFVGVSPLPFLVDPSFLESTTSANIILELDIGSVEGAEAALASSFTNVTTTFCECATLFPLFADTSECFQSACLRKTCAFSSRPLHTLAPDPHPKAGSSFRCPLASWAWRLRCRQKGRLRTLSFATSF